MDASKLSTSDDNYHYVEIKLRLQHYDLENHKFYINNNIVGIAYINSQTIKNILLVLIYQCSPVLLSSREVLVIEASRTNVRVLVLVFEVELQAPCPRPREFKSSKIFENCVG